MVVSRIFPSSPRRGGCAIKKILPNLVTTPSAPSRRLRDILLRSRPPLLGEEGKTRHPNISATSPPAREYNTSECQLDAELHVACGSGAGDASEIRCARCAHHRARATPRRAAAGIGRI